MSWEKSEDVPSVYVCKKPDGYTLMNESVNGIAYLVWNQREYKQGNKDWCAAMWAVMDPGGAVVASGLVTSINGADGLKEGAHMATDAYKKIKSAEAKDDRG